MQLKRGSISPITSWVREADVRSTLILIFIALFAFAAYSQTATPTPVNSPSAAPVVDEAYLAKDDGNGKAGEPGSTFFTTDIPIYCVVQLSSASGATVKMNLIAVSVAGVKADSKVLSTSYTTKDGQNRVSFTGKPYDKWNVGKYRVDVFVDGKLQKEMPFEIKPMSGSIDGTASFQPQAKPKTIARPKRP